MGPKELVTHFATLWRRRYERSYPIAWGKDTAQFKRLLQTYEFMELLSFVQFYLTSYRSDFARNAGHSIGVFVACLPDVIAQQVTEAAKEARAENTDENFKRLEEARNAKK